MAGFNLPLTIESYATRDGNNSRQRLLNCFVEKMPNGAKGMVEILGTSGLRSLFSISSEPIWGMTFVKNLLWVVSGNNVYKVEENGTSTLIGGIGAVNGNVNISVNDFQILIIKPNNDGYVVDVTAETVAVISDVDFPTASSSAFTSGFFVVTKPDSGQFFFSALNDATSWAALDFFTQESNPDNLVSIESSKGELWLFGAATTEIWYPTGDADVPFARIANGVINVGCAAANSPAFDQNGVYWLGNDNQVYFASGYSEQRISTHFIEREIGKMPNADVAKAIGFTYDESGHDLYVLTVPNQKTFVFDITTGVWHERKTKDIATWLPQNSAFAYNKRVMGDSTTGILYELDEDFFFDNTDYIEREVIFPTVWADNKRMLFDMVRVDFDSGVGLTTGQGSDPQVMLSWSDDGGQTYFSERWRSMGKKGEYKKRAMWRQMGQSRQRIYKLRVTDPVKFAISGMYAEGTICDG